MFGIKKGAKGGNGVRSENGLGNWNENRAENRNGNGMALSRSVFPPQLQFTKFGIEVVVVEAVVGGLGWVGYARRREGG